MPPEELGPLTVLASPGHSVNDDNPYIGLLYGHMQGVVVTDFSRRRLMDRYDVIHVHWPEFLVRWEGVRTAYPDVLKVLVLLALAKRRGAALVWTGHDLTSHEVVRPRLLRVFQAGFLRQVDVVINLADEAGPALRSRYPELHKTEMTTVRHGHYRDAYVKVTAPAAVRAALGVDQQATTLLMLGQLRDYKNGSRLIQEVRRRKELSLILAGRPHDASLLSELQRAAHGCDRIHALLTTVPHADVAGLHAAADVVVLPYRQGSTLHSGAALLALSLDRPVALARNGPAEELQAIVGSEWVYLHDGSVEDAVDVAVGAATQSRTTRAPLDDLNWDLLSAQTAAAYRRAISIRKGP